MNALELLRLADNRLETLPEWIVTHPTLAWVALAANPATSPWSEAAEARAAASAAEGGGAVDVPEVPWAALGIAPDAEPLGRGASGAVYAATLELEWEGDEGATAAAVKVRCRRVAGTQAAAREVKGREKLRKRGMRGTPRASFVFPHSFF